jgi:hypothetical protein
VDKSRVSHPWRRVPTVNAIASRRSPSFADYLERVTPEERRQIEAAERTYVMKTEAPNGARSAALRDFEEGMVGNTEDHHRLRRGLGLT